MQLDQSAGTLEYLDCISAEEQDLPYGYPDMTRNNLLARLHDWRSGVFGVLIQCHCSIVHSDP